jgi:endonuclease-3 related protein
MKPAKPCGPSAKSAKRLRKMYERLISEYGPQQWWPAATPFEVVIGAYLTQNTSWRAVERSIQNLAAHQALSIEGIRKVPEEELREFIRPSGYMVRKAAALKAFVAFLDRECNGSLEALAAVPASEIRKHLLALPGIGPETADAILLYALGHPAMVVDEYLRRIVTRHRMLEEKAKYPEIQLLAINAFHAHEPETLAQHYNEFHALVVMVGKNHCGPTPKCNGCPLEAFLSK